MEVLQISDAAGNGEQGTSPTAMAMNWTPEFQSIAFGQVEFSHQGPIPTDPTHDLAHLLIAASGNMPWAPEGDRAKIKMAEYNAVLVENLLANVFNSLVARRLRDDDALPLAAAHAAWFVEEHFAPFPISAEEAYRQFALDLDSEVIVRLSPHFFRMKLAERNALDFRSMDWIFSADATAAPEIEGSIERKYVDAVRHQMRKLKTKNLASILKLQQSEPRISVQDGSSMRGMQAMDEGITYNSKAEGITMEVTQPLEVNDQDTGEMHSAATAQYGHPHTGTSPTAMVMNWTPEFQSIAFGDAEFSHHGVTTAHPSHDLAHLFIAANGKMPWVPEGDDATIRIAEYNALMVEHIMDSTFTALITRRLKDDDAFIDAVAYMKWFVEESWAPFPITAEEAYRRFVRDVDCELMIRLSPHFFRIKLGEAKDRDFRLKEWTLSTDAMTTPEIEGPVERKYVHAVRHHFTKLKTMDPAALFKAAETVPAGS